MQVQDVAAALWAVGDGDLGPSFEAAAQALPESVRSRVVFAGTVAYRDLTPYYAAADLGVLPSRQPESFGMVLIEAMACGKPVVASDSPGVRSVVSDGADGRLAQRGDAAGLAAALRSLLAEPALRRAMGQRGRAKVEAKYAWERIGEQLDGLYANVVASTTPEAANAV